MSSRRHALRVLTAATCGATGLLGSPLARAQSWPDKPVTIIVPFPPGGGTDAFARPLSAALTKQWGQQVIIDNKGGAGGTVGAGIASRSRPDGYTFLLGAVHHAIAPSIYPKLDYDVLNDLVPVALISKVPQVIVVNAQTVPATDLKQLLVLLRGSPGKLNYGSAGNGTSHHLAGELFKMQTKTFITHIPYRGAGNSLQNLIAGQIEMMFDGLGSSAPHIKSGRIRALAVASEKRAPGFPDIPTSIEAGVPSYQMSTWYGLWAPKGTPPEVVNRMIEELNKVFTTPEMKATWTSLGADIPTLSGKPFGTFVAGEVKRWADVVKASGAKLD